MGEGIEEAEHDQMRQATKNNADENK